MTTSPAKQRTIKDIKNDDVRIQITGYIKEIIDNEHILLDDKTGEIEVNVKNVDFRFDKNDLVNIFGEIEISMAGEKSLIAEIIQDMKNLNFEYYQKLYQIKKELDLI
ncbi:MAG: NirD/YgiW/YdeI family stress tolerance protein [Promethearchaeota archaeon]